MNSNKTNKKKFDYNIIIIALCFMMVLFVLGLWSTKALFVVPITSALGISRSAYSIADTMRYISTAVINIFFGHLVGKFGSKKLICAGFVALTGAAVLYAVANSVWVFYKISLLICVGLMLAVVTLLQFVITFAHKERKRIMETL